MKYITISMLLFLSFSCTEDITIHTDNSKPVVVIYGILTDEFTQKSVKVTWSSPYFDTQPNVGISGATVKVTGSNDKTYEFFENDTVPGLYETKTKWAAETGVSYSLKVEINSDGDNNIYEASTTIFPSLGLDSIKIVPVEMMGHKNYSVNLYGNEPEGEDFYLCKFSVRDSLISSKLSKYLILDDVMFDGQYVSGLTLKFFDSIDNWATDSEERRKNSVYLASGDKVELQMSKIPKGYFEFITQCQREMEGSNPFFGGPPANITSNISNGGAGYFSGYCISRAEAITP
ncbi:MAG: DUF4249 domain-containing protein [Candidatus Azobacteroides sp.]|nr:DUF4249 domain-containing protein [Candidatus Azobacteroides sp.]